MLPRPIFYAFFFIGILSVETAIAATRLIIGETLQYDFIMLVAVTVMAMALFMAEGTILERLGNKKPL